MASIEVAAAPPLLDNDDTDDEDASIVAEGSEIARLRDIAANLQNLDVGDVAACATADMAEPAMPTPQTPGGVPNVRQLGRPSTPPGSPGKLASPKPRRRKTSSSSEAGSPNAAAAADPDADALPARAAISESPDLFDYFVVLRPAAALRRAGAAAAPLRSAEAVPLRPVVAARYPSSDKPGCPLPDAVGNFCFPRGLALALAASGEAPPPSLHSFCLTDTHGLRLYGSCLTFHDALAPADLAPLLAGAPLLPGAAPGGGSAPLVAPTGMCLLSRHPFAALQATALRQLYRHLEAELRERARQRQQLAVAGAAAGAAAGAGSAIAALLRSSALAAASALPVLPLERHIIHLFASLPLPPEGGAEVHATLGDVHLRLSRPAPRTVPLLDTSRGLAPLFELLSVAHIAELLALLLAEHKVALCAAAMSAPVEVLEALLSLLWPLEWQGAYVPTLPDDWDTILEMPVPFLVGLSSAYFERTPNPSDWAPDVVFVDLDRDVVHRRGIACVELPKHVCARLEKALAECGATALYVQPELRHHMPSMDLAFGSAGLAPTLGVVGDGGAGGGSVQAQVRGCAPPLATDWQVFSRSSTDSLPPYSTCCCRCAPSRAAARGRWCCPWGRRRRSSCPRPSRPGRRRAASSRCCCRCCRAARRPAAR